MQIRGGALQIWRAKQADGASVVGLFNLGAAASPMTVAWSDLGVTGSLKVRDLWARADVGVLSGAYQTTVASHGAALIRIGP
jgi:alpha-galactosidase